MGCKQSVISKAIISETGELEDAYFSVTLMIDKDNYLRVVDNNVDDWREMVDSNTLAVKEVKINL